MSAELDNVFVHKDDYYKELEKFYNGKKTKNITSK